MSGPKKVVLAYSGGLDTSIIIPWLKEHYDCEVHALAGDVGQGADELEGLEEKARASGAASCKVADLKHEFLTDYVWPCLRALAVYENRYLLGTSMARPILAKAQVEYAREVGASAVVHGCTGKGNDQVRFELGYMTLAPDLEIIAPWREWSITSREEAIAYADEHNIPITATKEKIYSRDRNLWHISHEGGALEDPENPPPDDAWMLTKSIDDAPALPETVTISFEAGVPTKVAGNAMNPVELVTLLNELGGQHGVGRVDITENRLVGMKSRGIYETPGGTILLEALQSLWSVCVERDTFRQAQKLMIDYADLVYAGRWFTPLREALDAFFASAAAPVTGEVDVKLHKGHATPIAIRGAASLYRDELATFTMGSGYKQEDAEGFIRLYGLPSKVAAEVARTGATS